ncbi:MAG TPA: hypothetical protein PKJ47_02980 [Candidatus Limiplasma sp.]|nr:hypothetical protein [Candidatus Limiplasma sp.]
MFEDWKAQMNEYASRHIQRKPFADIADELDRDIAEISDLYTAVLQENGVIDENGSDTDIDFDEDDLLESILERFLQNHPCSEDREVLYAGLIDAYLALVEESSEDM